MLGRVSGPRRRASWLELPIDNRSVYAAVGHGGFDPSADSVVFLHGVGSDHTEWVLPTRFFDRKGRNVMALDFPGNGRSEGPTLNSIHDMADWVVRTLDVAGIETTALIGNSMGSLVSVAAAAKYPDRIRSMALLGIAYPMGVSDELMDNAKRNDVDTIQMLNVWGHSRRAQIGHSDVPGMWMMGRYARLLGQAAPDVIYAGLKACDDFSDGLDLASTIPCPVLFLLGSRDSMTPAHSAKALADAIPRTRTVTFPNAGHDLLAERPDPVLDELITIV